MLGIYQISCIPYGNPGALQMASNPKNKPPPTHTHTETCTLSHCQTAQLYKLMPLAASTAALPCLVPSCTPKNDVCKCVFFWGRRRFVHVRTYCICAYACSHLHSAGHKKDFIHSSCEVSQRLTSRCSHSRPANCKQTQLCLSAFTTLHLVFLMGCLRVSSRNQ